MAIASSTRWKCVSSVRSSRSGVGALSAATQTRAIASTTFTGQRPVAVSAESMTASVPSITALATSETSARVGSGLVIIDSIKRVADSGKPVTRSAVRDAIQSAKVQTLQGEVAFDQNGDLLNKVISIFQIRKDPKYPLDDILHQYHYVDVAPEV